MSILKLKQQTELKTLAKELRDEYSIKLDGHEARVLQAMSESSNLILQIRQDTQN